MRRPFPILRPAAGHGSARENLTAWLILASAGLVVAAALSLSLAGAAASWFTGHGWRWAGGVDTGIRVLTDGPRTVWPTVDPDAVWTAWGIQLTVLATAAVLAGVSLLRWRAGDPDPARHMARPRDVAALCPQQVHDRALRLRPSLADRPAVDPADTGMLLGELMPGGPDLRSSWEDGVVCLMPPRAGKTTAVAVGAIIEAPGAVVATSNKADVLTTTLGMRQQAGTCWVFDPQSIAYTEQAMYWNPLDCVREIADARRLAGHFLQEVMATNSDRDFWSSAALGLLSSLIMAAADKPGGTLRDVWDWLNDSTSRVPIGHLRRAGHISVAAGLEGRQSGAWETREGIYETARSAAQCLESEQIMAWITPPSKPVPKLDLSKVVTGRDTLYLLSKEDPGAAQPLVAALADETLRAAERIGEANGGRIDPPLLPVLDEAANICKIRDLPKRYSHCGSRGIPIVTILQNYEQGKVVWGENGMNTLWSAATVKVVGGGIDDARLLKDLSELVGEHDVSIATRSRDARGGWSESLSLRTQPKLRPNDIRALPAWQGLLLATRCRVALIRLRPWFEGPHAEQITAASDAAMAELTARAANAEAARP